MNTNIETKVCTKCGEEKALSEYHKMGKYKDVQKYRSDCKACFAGYCKDNKEKRKAYYKANAEAISEQKKAYYKANAEVIKEKNKAYRKDNPLVTFKSDSKKRGAPIFDYQDDIMNALHDQQLTMLLHQRNELTELTGIPHEVDHIVPISQGGMTVWFNLRVIPANENKQKYAKPVPLPTSPEYRALTINRTGEAV